MLENISKQLQTVAACYLVSFCLPVSHWVGSVGNKLTTSLQMSENILEGSSETGAERVNVFDKNGKFDFSLNKVSESSGASVKVFSI